MCMSRAVCGAACDTRALLSNGRACHTLRTRHARSPPAVIQIQPSPFCSAAEQSTMPSFEDHFAFYASYHSNPKYV
jgi:hypothetical protein